MLKEILWTKNRVAVSGLLAGFMGAFCITALVIPVHVYADTKNDAATALCKETKSVSESLCRNAFFWGYNQADKGVPPDPNPCEKEYPPGPGEGAYNMYVVCSKGYNFRDSEKKKADEVSKSPEAKNACQKRDYKDKQLDACNYAYGEAKADRPYSHTCTDDKYPQGSKQREACDAGFALGGGLTPPPKEQPDCNVTLDSLLSWIACPVIDLGVNMTDWVFKDIVQPMMENVPVSTNPDDGSFKAWSQVRLIANILLVGTLLAIIYSQARGGGK